MPAAQPAVASHYPQDYSQQNYSDNGYVAQDYAQGVGSQYDQSGITAQYAENPYAQSYAQTDYSAQPMQAYHADAQYDANAYSQGNAALDVYDNPYLSGQSQAGAIDQVVSPVNSPYQS